MSEPGTDGVLSVAEREVLLSRIRDIPDWPEPGVVFKDITPLLLDHAAFASMISALAAPGHDQAGTVTVDTVVGIEARGFILAAPVAHILGVGLVPIRKQGKLPYRTRSASYQLEYGQATIEVHEDAFAAGDRVLIVDDVLATGGTVEAAAGLVTAAGADVAAVSVLMELGFLSGRNRLAGLDLRALLRV
ncbi:MAG TPA: adenine phosphoribosyltransferase [Jiangellaceae bacterium]|jgi:adenine phosphoribosyltransferase|nr:adenine phosphoribosyltransferase [Jiangellaceae bacterium]